MDRILEVVWSVKTAQRLLERRFSRILRPLGVTPIQAEALLILAEAGPLPIKTLGEMMVAEPGHPSRLADRLTAAGWVSRDPAPEDRRMVRLRLTDAGTELASKIIDIRRPFLEWGDRALADAGLEEALPAIRRLLTILRDVPDDTERITRTT